MAAIRIPFVVGKRIRDIENALKRRLLDVWRAGIPRLTEQLQQTSTLPNAYWNELEQRQREAIGPWCERVIAQGITQGKQALGVKAVDVEVAVDWALVNDNAVRWAHTYTYDLVSGITATTRDRLQGAIGDWLEAGEAFPALQSRVTEIFNDPVRAEMIAVTETTRVIAEGNTQAWEALGVPEREWRTAVDELVCPICGGLHQKRAKVGEPFPGNIANPPAHPNCRCTIVPVIKPERSPAPGVGQERVVINGREQTVTAGYRPSVEQLTEGWQYTLLDTVRLTGERRIHYQERHPETGHLSTAEEERLLTRALFEPVLRVSDPKNPRNERRYIQDENGKWWRVVVGLGSDEQWFILSFQRVHGPGK